MACYHGYRFFMKFMLHFQIHFSPNASEIQGSDICHCLEEGSYILNPVSKPWVLHTHFFKKVSKFVKNLRKSKKIQKFMLHFQICFPPNASKNQGSDICHLLEEGKNTFNLMLNMWAINTIFFNKVSKFVKNLRKSHFFFKIWHLF